jgi:hypothetical protein
MSLRPRREPNVSFALEPGVANVGYNATERGRLRTVAPSPYNDRAHLEPKQFEDHDGGPWKDTPAVVPKFRPVKQKWVVAPALGASSPAICVFPRRLSNNVSFAPDVHLSFESAWTPIIARFSQLYLTDVDKKGNMPGSNQLQHWLCTFKGKTNDGITSVTIRIRVNNQGDQLEGWALHLPDTDFVQSFIDFPPPPAAQVGFDSSTAVVVNGAFTTLDPQQVQVVFSKLDESVERERREERARQAWGCKCLNIKYRCPAIAFLLLTRYATNLNSRTQCSFRTSSCAPHRRWKA